MIDKGTVGLWEAYLQVHQPKEEVEQLDESGLSQDTIRSAVKKRQERVDAAYREDTPEGDKRGDEGMKKLARSKRQLDINKPREVRMRANEEVENWVNSLIDEGYDLSEYTWDDMYEMYVTEANSIAAMRAGAARRRKQRYGASDTSRGGRDDFAPITDYEAANKKWERPTQKENVDLFDAILEHLVAEGYADTNENALVIMANMSEEWRDGILQQLDELSDWIVKATRNKLKRNTQSKSPLDPDRQKHANREFRFNKRIINRNQRTGSNVSPTDVEFRNR